MHAVVGPIRAVVDSNKTARSEYVRLQLGSRAEGANGAGKDGGKDTEAYEDAAASHVNGPVAMLTGMAEEVTELAGTGASSSDGRRGGWHDGPGRDEAGGHGPQHPGADGPLQ
eukprot:8415732-Alexandrium_andersonii.AAC.1